MGIADKARNFLNSEKGEQRSDDILDRAADMGNKKTGGKYEEKVTKARDAADKRLGNE